MSVFELEKFRQETYTRAQADLAEQIRFRLLKGDTVDAIKLLDEAEKRQRS